jgi:GT2 family glycosyltransferase
MPHPDVNAMSTAALQSLTEGGANRGLMLGSVGSVVPRVMILVLNWNNWRDTVDCLASLAGLEYGNCEILVLDNGSTDGSAERISSVFPKVEVIKLGENMGFGRANNVGIRIALERRAEFVWLLNNDTTVDSKSLRAMVDKAHEDPRIGAVGSAIYYADEPDALQVWGGGGLILWCGRSFHFRRAVSDANIHFLTGASLLLRRSVLETVGLFDEAYFLYWEDVDYSLRLRRAGWNLAVAGDSSVWHKESATAGKNKPQLDMNFARSASRFFSIYSPVPIVSIWMNVVLRIAKRMLNGDWAGARAVWAGSRPGDAKSTPASSARN